jgi:nucleoid-associated protein YgaU
MAVNSKLEKAYIQLMKPSASGAAGKISEVKFQFNPKEFTVKKSASWESKPAKGAKSTSMPEFKGAEPRSMSIEAFLDGTESATDITKDIEVFFQCCTPLGETVGKNKPSPPFVIFGWGKKMSVTAFVKSVSAKYTLFKPDGTPVRAVVTLDLQEIPGTTPKQNPTSGGFDVRTSHTVVSGDSLQSIAFQEYGDPNLWRAIATANGVTDPLRLRSGLRLLIPTPEEAASNN